MLLDGASTDTQFRGDIVISHLGGEQQDNVYLATRQMFVQDA